MLSASERSRVPPLSKINSIDDRGVVFQSHVDGARVSLDPAASMRVQNDLGADIIMALDQCPALPCDEATAEAAVRRTIDWAGQCKQRHGRADQWLFGIVQGALDSGLRRRCAEALMEIGFDGYAVGGLSVGESHGEMMAVLDGLAEVLPAGKPRYLMGVGMPRDLYEAVRRGIDLFDCVLPTRNGRNAYAFRAAGPLKLRNAVHRLSGEPIEAGCDCYTCGRFSRGYLRHLFLAGEMLGPTLTTIHNLRFFQRLMARMRDLIPAGQLATIPAEFPIVEMGGGDSDSNDSD